MTFACFLSAALADSSSTWYASYSQSELSVFNAVQLSAAAPQTSSQAVAQAPALPDSQVSLALSIAVSIADFDSLVCTTGEGMNKDL